MLECDALNLDLLSKGCFFVNVLFIAAFFHHILLTQTQVHASFLISLAVRFVCRRVVRRRCWKGESEARYWWRRCSLCSWRLRTRLWLLLWQWRHIVAMFRALALLARLLTRRVAWCCLRLHRWRRVLVLRRHERHGLRECLRVHLGLRLRVVRESGNVISIWRTRLRLRGLMLALVVPSMVSITAS